MGVVPPKKRHAVLVIFYSCCSSALLRVSCIASTPPANSILSPALAIVCCRRHRSRFMARVVTREEKGPWLGVFRVGSFFAVFFFLSSAKLGRKRAPCSGIWQSLDSPSRFLRSSFSSFFFSLSFLLSSSSCDSRSSFSLGLSWH